jgi:hypothetical protein
MFRSTKVLWGEGQFLRPQHFQLQDAYHEWRLAEMATSLHPYAWGLRKLSIDTDALASGVLRIDQRGSERREIVVQAFEIGRYAVTEEQRAPILAGLEAQNRLYGLEETKQAILNDALPPAELRKFKRWAKTAQPKVEIPELIHVIGQMVGALTARPTEELSSLPSGPLETPTGSTAPTESDPATGAASAL